MEKSQQLQVQQNYNMSQEDIDKIDNQLEQIIGLLDLYFNKVKELRERVENMEKMIAKVPEFYEYWKGLNACGYQD